VATLRPGVWSTSTAPPDSSANALRGRPIAPPGEPPAALLPSHLPGARSGTHTGQSRSDAGVRSAGGRRKVVPAGLDTSRVGSAQRAARLSRRMLPRCCSASDVVAAAPEAGHIFVGTPQLVGWRRKWRREPAGRDWPRTRRLGSNRGGGCTNRAGPRGQPDSWSHARVASAANRSQRVTRPFDGRPDGADGKHQRPKRRNGIAAFAGQFNEAIGAVAAYGRSAVS
jgi:hypothetical protein